MKSHVALPGCLGPLFWVLFAGKSRKIHCGCPFLEGSSSPWHAQRGIEAWNSFGFFPRVSRVYFEKFHRSSKQRQVINWTSVPPSYQHFLRSSWMRSHQAPLLEGNAASLPFPLQPGLLLARHDLQLCHLLHPALFLLPQSDLLMLHVFNSFLPFLPIPSSEDGSLLPFLFSHMWNGFPGSICSLLPTVSNPAETPLI